MLANAIIHAAIRARLDEMAVSANEALQRLAQVARGDTGDFLAIGDDGTCRTDLARPSAAGKLHLIKRDVTRAGELRPKRHPSSREDCAATECAVE